MDDLMIRMLQLSGKGYACSQILIQLFLEEREEANPSLVRAMAGPAYGCGSGKATCGALTGGCCCLALYAGKGADHESPADDFPLMLQELNDWFEEKVGKSNGGVTCEAIVGEEGPSASRQVCGQIVGDTYAKVVEILLSHDVDLSGS